MFITTHQNDFSKASAQTIEMATMEIDIGQLSWKIVHSLYVLLAELTNEICSL